MEGAVKKGQSKLGVASFIMIIFACILYIIQDTEAEYLHQFELYRGVEKYFTGLILLLPFVALILGVLAFLEKERRKDFAIAGIVITILAMAMLCGYAFLIASIY